jgi:hypothetical protein
MKVTIPMGRLQSSSSKPTGINLRSNSSMSNPTSGISAVRVRLYRAWSVGRPISGEPVTSGYGLEVQTFNIDGERLRFAVDQAADLVLAVSRKM